MTRVQKSADNHDFFFKCIFLILCFVLIFFIELKELDCANAKYGA